jgi:hypothetical protein
MPVEGASTSVCETNFGRRSRKSSGISTSYQPDRNDFQAFSDLRRKIKVRTCG